MKGASHYSFFYMQWLQTCFSWTLSFSLFQLSLPSLCCLFASFFYSDPGSNPRVQPLKIGGWHVIPFIRHLGAMLGFKRVLIITTLYRHFWNAVVSICSLNMLKFYVKSYIHIVGSKIDKSVIFCWLFFILPMLLSFTSTHVQKLM